MKSIAYQPELSPALPVVIGNADYKQFRETLIQIDRILEQGGIETEFVFDRLAAYEQEIRQRARREGEPMRMVSEGELARVARHATQALRCNISREFIGLASRPFSIRLADSPLLQWFCQKDQIDGVRVPGKSTIDRYGKMVPEGMVRKIVNRANQLAISGEEGLGFSEPLGITTVLLDTTCVKANIHFPVDWVLLRDATRTLMKATAVIRKHGLRHRMSSPKGFIKRMNRLAIEMTHARGKDSKKKRKRVLRLMKTLLKVIRAHAQRHRDLLELRWQETDLIEGQVRVLRERIDRVLEILPRAIKQAHERIIGGRKVVNAEKILSLYDDDINVIVRGKASAPVEFGNTLLLAEQADGLIVDWKLYKEQVPADSALVPESLDRIGRVFGYYPEEAVGDRGLDSAENRRFLAGRRIYNGLCPRSPSELRKRMGEQRFARLQTRRAQTEARVAILQNGFLGRPMRSKGFLNREINVSWAVLAHNLWVMARLMIAQDKQEPYEKAA